MPLSQGPKNIEENNLPEQSDKKILQQTKDVLRYLWRDVTDRLHNGVDAAKNAVSNSLQSLDKWLSSEKQATRQDISRDLTVLHDYVIQHPKTPMERPSFVQDEIDASADGLKQHIIEEASRDPDPVASALGQLMRYIMQTEK